MLQGDELVLDAKTEGLIKAVVCQYRGGKKNHIFFNQVCMGLIFLPLRNTLSVEPQPCVITHLQFFRHWRALQQLRMQRNPTRIHYGCKAHAELGGNMASNLKAGRDQAAGERIELGWSGSLTSDLTGKDCQSTVEHVRGLQKILASNLGIIKQDLL